MNYVILKGSAFPPLKIEQCEFKVGYFFHESSVKTNQFFNDVVKVYEDMSHSWGVMWFPGFTLDFQESLFNILGSYKKEFGVMPNVRETTIIFLSKNLSDAVSQPKMRNGLNYHIKSSNGYKAENNRGFVHYMALDGLFQKLQEVIDEMANLGYML